MQCNAGLSHALIQISFVRLFGAFFPERSGWYPRDCLKFQFWNLNGYSDLSAVEGIVGGGEGEWEGEKTRGVQVGVKVTNGANVG